MQRANKDALEKLDPKQVYYTFPDRREGSKSSLILKKPKTKKSNRILYMTKPLQLLQSDGDFKSVQGNTGHATAAVLMDTYAHTQDKPRLELTEKIEANFYSQDLTPVAPHQTV